jgi:hypothetical protein
VYWNEVRVFGAPWLRLTFDDIVLSGVKEAGNGSYLIITSLRDNAWQRLDSESIREWSNTSAYFNGDAVRIEMFAYPGTGPNLMRMSHVTGGLFENQPGPDTICGNVDDRTLSSFPAQGRIFPIGCTGWLIGNSGCANRLLTAGHCFPTGVAQQVMEFNVPLSTSTGALVHPPPQHQYSVDMATIQRAQTVIGNDWAQFFTAANSNTGLHARQMQGGAAYTVGNAPAPAGQTLRCDGVRHVRSERSDSRRGPAAHADAGAEDPHGRVHAPERHADGVHRGHDGRQLRLADRERDIAEQRGDRHPHQRGLHHDGRGELRNGDPERRPPSGPDEPARLVRSVCGADMPRVSVRERQRRQRGRGGVL